MTEHGTNNLSATKIREKALETALEAAGLTGQQLILFMKAIAVDSGWLSNCNTVDDMVKAVVNKYPLLRGARSVLGELRMSFKQGRKIAETERLKGKVPVRTREHMRMPVVAVRSKIRREDFAGYEEVPLEEETDLGCEPEQLEAEA